jgi:hypothetical protein
MVSSLLAGVRALLANSREGLMPESLTRRESAYVNLWGVRLHVGMASGFSSERCPASPRNRVRLQVGIASGIASEYLAGISRNLQVREKALIIVGRARRRL